MRYARLAFHVLMLALVALAFSAAFTSTSTGGFMWVGGNRLSVAVALILIWIAGEAMFRTIRRFPKH